MGIVDQNYLRQIEPKVETMPEGSKDIKQQLREKVLSQRRVAIFEFMKNYDLIFDKELSPVFTDPVSLIESKNERTINIGAFGDNQSEATNESDTNLPSAPGNSRNGNHTRTLRPTDCNKEAIIHPYDLQKAREILDKKINSNKTLTEDNSNINWEEYSGNWMSFDNPIENWHVGNQGRTNSCNGWVFADSIITFYHYKFISEKNKKTHITIKNKHLIEIDRKILPSVRYIWKSVMSKDLLDQGYLTEEILDDATDTRMYPTFIDLINLRYLPSRNKIPFMSNSPFPLFNNDRETSIKPCDDENSCFISASTNKLIGFNIFDQKENRFCNIFENHKELTIFLAKWIHYMGPLAIEMLPPVSLRTVESRLHCKSENESLCVPEISTCEKTEAIDALHTMAITGITHQDGEHHLILRNQFGIDWGYFGQASIPLKSIFNKKYETKIVILIPS